MVKKTVNKKNQTFEYDSDRILCLTYCPDCKSENISVTFKPEFEYTYCKNHESIGLHCKYKSIEIKCKDCYYWQSTSNSSLSQFISEALNIRYETFIEKNDDRSFLVYNTLLRELRIE